MSLHCAVAVFERAVRMNSGGGVVAKAKSPIDQDIRVEEDGFHEEAPVFEYENRRVRSGKSRGWL